MHTCTCMCEAMLSPMQKRLKVEANSVTKQPFLQASKLLHARTTKCFKTSEIEGVQMILRSHENGCELAPINGHRTFQARRFKFYKFQFL